ncbi:MAG: hypothetical protein K9J27_11545 [Bacteroidales bacterium]|nr:hypothetical protein [Bacteroidales bacterium]
MIELYLNDNLVVLPEDTSIRIEKYNPLFNKMKSRSFHFAIPYGENRHLFNIDGQLPFTLMINGLVDMQGIAEIEEGIDYNENEIELYLQENDTFWESVKNEHLDDYDFGSEQLPSTESERKALFDDIVTNEKMFPDSNYTLPMFHDTEAQANIGDRNNVNEYNFWFWELSDKSETQYSISVYLRFVLRTLFMKEGFQIEQDDMDGDSDFNRLLIMSFTEFDILLSTIPYRVFLPHITFKDFFETLEALFGLRFIINKDKIRILLFDQLLKQSDLIIADWSEVQNHKKHKLEKIEQSFAYTGISHPDYDDITEYFSEDDIQSTYPNRSDFGDSTGLLPDLIYKSELTQRLYKPDGNGGWVETGNLRAYGNEEQKNEAKAAVFFTTTKTRSWTGVAFESDGGDAWGFDVTITYVVSETRMNYNPIGAKDDPFTKLVLLYNRGIEDREITKYYNDMAYYNTFKIPHVTYDVYINKNNIENLAFPNQKSLRWHTEYGLYNNYKKLTDHWERYRKRKVIKYFYMTTGQVKNIQWESKYKIDDRIYFINKLEYNVTHDGISIVKAELFTV